MGYSVVIPTFNGARTLRRAIDSVLDQTLEAAEVLVIDDGSTDGTAELVQQRYGSRIGYVWQPNQGVASARNTGVRLATQDLVAFLDHDDEWLPAKLQRQAQVLDRCPEAVGTYCAFWAVGPNGSRECRHLAADDLWPAVRLRNPFPPSTVALRRKALVELGGFNAMRPGASCEDWELFFRLVQRYRVVDVPQPLVNYYDDEVSAASRNYRFMLANELSIVEGLLDGLVGVRRAAWRRRIKATLYYRAAIAAREAGDPAGGYLTRSFAQWPLPDVEPRRFKTGLVLLSGRRPKAAR